MLGLFAPTPAFSRAAWAWGLALAVTLPAGAQTPAAAPAAGAQAPSALQRWHVRYDLGPDGRATMTQELHNQVLQAGALEDLKTYSIGFSNGIQQGQVLEAYTLKQDGRRIDVPANNFQTQTSDGHQGGKPFFSDRTRITVVFPDLAVGDTVHVKGHTSDFNTKVESMQVNHAGVAKARTGDNVGMKVPAHAHEHDKVYKVVPDA